MKVSPLFSAPAKEDWPAILTETGQGRRIEGLGFKDVGELTASCLDKVTLPSKKIYCKTYLSVLCGLRLNFLAATQESVPVG